MERLVRAFRRYSGYILAAALAAVAAGIVLVSIGPFSQPALNFGLIATAIFAAVVAVWMMRQ